MPLRATAEGSASGGTCSLTEDCQAGPNSALPLPTAIANVYQGVLPTYLYAFQFPVNNVAANVPIHIFSAVPLLLAGSMIFLSIVVGYSAWVWRLALAERAADERDALELKTGGGGAAIVD